MNHYEITDVCHSTALCFLSGCGNYVSKPEQTTESVAVETKAEEPLAPAVIRPLPDTTMNALENSVLNMQLRDLTPIYLQVCKTLEELSSLEEKDLQAEEAFAKLEYIQQTQLCTSMYDVSFCRDYWYVHF